MTTNWIEEIKSKFKIAHSNKFLDDFNKQFKTPEERLLWVVFGKAGDKTPQEKLIDFITTLLEKQREEYVEMVRDYQKKDSDFILHMVCNDIINLIRSKSNDIQ